MPGFGRATPASRAGTGGRAGVRLLRRGEGAPGARGATMPTSTSRSSPTASVTLEGEGQEPRRLGVGDAFVIPPGMSTCLCEPTEDVGLLEVTLPATFGTRAA